MLRRLIDIFVVCNKDSILEAAAEVPLVVQEAEDRLYRHSGFPQLSDRVYRQNTAEDQLAALRSEYDQYREDAEARLTKQSKTIDNLWCVLALLGLLIILAIGYTVVANVYDKADSSSSYGTTSYKKVDTSPYGPDEVLYSMRTENGNKIICTRLPHGPYVQCEVHYASPTTTQDEADEQTAQELEDRLSGRDSKMANPEAPVAN